MNTERYEVVKAGGWSLASGPRIKSVVDYIQSNPDVHYFVPSAPGAIGNRDTKVTDLLIACYHLRARNQAFASPFAQIYDRFANIAKFWGYPNLEKLLDPVEQGLNQGRNYDWVISRGEWINGMILADILNWHFVDPTELIRFREDGRLDERSYMLIGRRLRGRDRFVVPGFYGLDSSGLVKTFERDGSDVTGSVVARGTHASIYRNLTNTNGIFSADPRVVDNPKLVHELTFEEYRELGNGGVKVLHRDTIIPVAEVRIPINVRHSEKPASCGSTVVDERVSGVDEGVIGVAGKSGFTSLNIYRPGMNEEQRIISGISQIFSRNGISIEHAPSGTDYMSVIFESEQLDENSEYEIANAVRQQVEPKRIGYEKKLGLLNVVGQNIRDHCLPVSAKLFSTLNNNDISAKGYILGVSGINITVVVDGEQIDKAIRVAHAALIQ